MLAALPALCFGLLLLAIWRRRGGDPRSAFISAAVAWGVTVLAITEGLSLSGRLTLPALTLSWLAAALGTLLLFLESLGPARTWSYLKAGKPCRVDLAILAPAVAIILVTGLIALVRWPNEADSQAYHLPRVAHWIQNESVAHYPTHVLRQLFQPPWAEFAALHLSLLGGDERLSNLVQWFSMLGSVIGVSVIARQLGASSHGQTLAALFCATLPMGILQASNTKNDYAATFWLVCLTYGLVSLGPRAPLWAWAGPGASLGLFGLTKATAPIFAAPVLLLLWLARGRPRVPQLLREGALMGLVALMLYAPHHLRNAELFATSFRQVDGSAGGGGTPNLLYSPNLSVANEAASPQILASNAVRNIAIHLGTPLRSVNVAIEDGLRGWHGWMGLDLNDPRTTWREFEFVMRSPQPYESRAGNFVHVLLILGGVPFLFLRRSSLVLRYGLAMMLSFLLFCLVLKWQIWGSRLQLPLFVLCAPLIGIMLQRRRVLGVVASVLMVAWSLPFLLDNLSHSLLSGRNAFQQNRVEQYFRHHSDFKSSYIGATDMVQSMGCDQVGLVAEWDSWEYPLWVLLPRVQYGDGELRHVGVVANRSRRYAGRQASFSPCAVINLNNPSVEELELNGRSYQRLWLSPRPGKSVGVYAPR